MKIKFIKEYCTCFRDEENIINTETFKPDDTVSTSMEMDRYFTEELARWLINNGFAEEVKESDWWKPMMGDRYYFIDDSGCIKEDIWGNNFWDVDRYKLGNVFKTEEAVKRYRDYLKAIAIVRQDEGMLTPEQVDELIKDEGLAYYVGYMVNPSNEKVLLGCPMNFDDCWTPVGVILFDSEAHVDRSLRKHPDEWKIIVNYDWSRE